MTRKILSHSLLFFLALGSACSGSDEDALDLAPFPSEQIDLAADSVLAVTGVYRIPVEEARLRGFAESSPYVISWRQDEGFVELQYPMPLELTGVSQMVTMSGSIENGLLMLDGPAGAAACGRAPGLGDVACSMVLDGLQFDPAGLRQNLQSRGMSQMEIDDRVRVAELFSADPIGVLAITFPQSPSGAY